MKSLLILRNIEVENANAIAGLTWGFPAISHFLGFTHALSRKLEKDHQLTLGACAVVCHRHHVRAFQPAGWGDYAFSLTRNPLTKEANSPSFVEEGRMHMEVSLIIACDFTAGSFDFGTDNLEQDIKQFEAYILEQVLQQRLAGGTITGMRRNRPVQFSELPEDYAERETFQKRQMRRLLPGFALVNRADLLDQHFQKQRADNPAAELMDAWLDFVALKYQATTTGDGDEASTAIVADATAATNTADPKTTWQRIEKPANGWLVPITCGYKAISPLYANGDVANTRDNSTPFRLVESAYTIGQWISPHRVQALEHLFWHYHVEDDWYLCQNNYRPTEPGDTPEPEAA